MNADNRTIGHPEILIVDDSVPDLKLMTDILTEAGYKVRPAKDGELALRSMKAKLPALVVLDINLPGMNGYEICRHFKDDASAADIPVIFVSASDETIDKVKAFDVGGRDFIQKPFQEEEVLARVRSHLRLYETEMSLKAANERLTDSEARYRALFEGISDAIFVHPFSMDEGLGNFIEVNDVACRNLGYSREELMNMSPEDIDASDSEVDRKGIARELAKGRNVFYEQTHMTRDGRRVPVEIHARHFKLAGQPAVISIVRDITNRKLAEKKIHEYANRLEEKVEERTRELKKAQEELLIKERLAVLGNIAGSISHEIRNPLAVISSSAYFLKMKFGNSDEKIDRHLTFIFDNVNKATAIIESLLNLTRMEKPKTKKTDLADLVSNTLGGINVPDTIVVILNFPDRRIFADIDAEQIRMALINVVNNAFQSMNNSGKLTITLRASESGRPELIISDTGSGIFPEHLEKVFEPLFTTKAQGIGFGLSITRMIIENQGGTIRAESEPGKGATFAIALPKIAEKELGKSS